MLTENIPPQEIEDNFGRAVRDIVDQVYPIFLLNVEEQKLVSCREAGLEKKTKDLSLFWQKFSFCKIWIDVDFLCSAERGQGFNENKNQIK